MQIQEKLEEIEYSINSIRKEYSHIGMCGIKFRCTTHIMRQTAVTAHFFIRVHKENI